MDNHRVQHTANRKAIVGLCKFFGALILIGGIVYSEILFLGIVGMLFPSGPMAIGAMLGAVTTGASILLLVLAKASWFRPGSQLAIAWIFTGVEVAVLIMNDMLAYQIHQGGQLDQYMSLWRLFCVAAPVLSVIGWILCFYFDPQRSIEHRRMEMEDDQAKAQIDFETSMHSKVLSARYKAADTVGAKLEEIIESNLEHSYRIAAAKLAARVATDLTGEHVSHLEVMGNSPKPQLGSGKIVDASPPRQAASRDQVLDPHNVRDAIKKEKKPLIDLSLPESAKGKETQKIEPEPEPEEEVESGKDTTEMSMDEAWAHHAAENAEAHTETPKRKGRGGKKSGKVTRREVLGMENQGD